MQVSVNNSLSVREIASDIRGWQRITADRHAPAQRVSTNASTAVTTGVGNEADFEPLARRRTVVFFDIRNRGRSDPVPTDGKVGFSPSAISRRCDRR